MKDYNNLVDALQDLKARGYTNDFNLKSQCLECSVLNLQLRPEDFKINEMYRFEGDSTPDDNSVLFALESIDGIKGVLVDAYGTYTEAISPKMAMKLRQKQ